MASRRQDQSTPPAGRAAHAWHLARKEKGPADARDKAQLGEVAGCQSGDAITPRRRSAVNLAPASMRPRVETALCTVTFDTPLPAPGNFLPGLDRTFVPGLPRSIPTSSGLCGHLLSRAAISLPVSPHPKIPFLADKVSG
jgi:hypothetical protein